MGPWTHCQPFTCLDALLGAASVSLRVTRQGNCGNQGAAIKQRLDIKFAAKLLDARYSDREHQHRDHRAPNIDPPRLDRGRAQEDADQRRQKILEPDARLADPQLRGEDDACAGREKTGYDECDHDISADWNPIERSGLRTGPDRVEL